MDIKQDIIDRVFKAADTLYEEDGRRRAPAVDAVRRLAQVNMNDASRCMKEWRKQWLAQTELASEVSIPEDIQRTQSAALTQLWLSAQSLANEALQAEKERLESLSATADELRVELSHAYDAQADELKQAQAQIQSLESECANAQGQVEIAQGLAAEERVKFDQLEKRTEDLQQGIAEAKAERAEALKEASAAREEKARLEGQLEALQQQNKELMAAVKSAGKGGGQ